MAKKKRKKKKTATQKLWSFLKFQMVLILLVLGAVAYYFVGGYAVKVKELHDEAVSYVARASADTFRQNETSIAYDVNGDVIQLMIGDKDVYYVEYADMPAYLRQAIVSIEDKRFYSHHGVDYKAIVRAVYAMFRNGEVTQGASTITQQLARTTFLNQDQTWERKIEEIYIAVELEKKFSKNEILEFYLNNINFANGYYGIGAASRGYFNKDVGKLSLSEIAFLCAIPNGPVKYDPIEHYDNTIERRNLVLKNMLDDQMITELTYLNAVEEEIALTRPNAPGKNDYLSTYTFYCATRVLMELQGFDFQTEFSSKKAERKYNKTYDALYEECNKSLYTGGYRIYTSLDMATQELLQYSLDANLAGFTEVNDEGIYALQGAAVCIDNTTGMVRAIVGGRTQDVSGYTLNRAYQSFRQPGSSIKPLLVYTPALERGYTADSILIDEPIEDGPENADLSYAGAITLRHAVEISKNTVAYKLLEELTPEVGLSYLHAMDFASLSKNDVRPIIAVGGFTYGASPLEMAKGFATLENDGAYRNPGCVTKITDADGNEIFTVEQTEKVVYEKNAARQMTDILKGVFTNGTAKSVRLSNMPCAGKTGTTNDNKDGWLVGYTRYYTTSVWVGYDIPREVPGLSWAVYPGKIWHSFMTRVHEGLEPQDFPAPASTSAPEREPELTQEQLELRVLARSLEGNTDNADAAETPDEDPNTAEPQIEENGGM